jgi:hypothetical protein
MHSRPRQDVGKHTIIVILMLTVPPGRFIRYSLLSITVTWDFTLSTELPELKHYLKLFELYRGKLDFSVKGTRDGDYSLIFEQVIRLLLKPSPFNNTLPAPFISVAERYAFNEPATVGHFRYHENKQFFLSDLYDSLMIYQSEQRPCADGHAE